MAVSGVPPVLRLRCATAGACRASGSLRHGRAVVLGRFSGTVLSGRVGRIRLTFTRAGRPLLARHRRLRARARLRISNPDGQRVAIRGRVRLIRR